MATAEGAARASGNRDVQAPSTAGTEYTGTGDERSRRLIEVLKAAQHIYLRLDVLFNSQSADAVAGQNEGLAALQESIDFVRSCPSPRSTPELEQADARLYERIVEAVCCYYRAVRCLVASGNADGGLRHSQAWVCLGIGIWYAGCLAEGVSIAVLSPSEMEDKKGTASCLPAALRRTKGPIRSLIRKIGSLRRRAQIRAAQISSNNEGNQSVAAQAATEN